MTLATLNRPTIRTAPERLTANVNTTAVNRQRLAQLIEEFEHAALNHKYLREHRPLALVIKHAVSQYNIHHMQTGGGGFATVDGDPEFIRRLTVNYLRHQRTPYDAYMKRMEALCGRNHAVCTYMKALTHAVIVKRYPGLAA